MNSLLAHDCYWGTGCASGRVRDQRCSNCDAAIARAGFPEASSLACPVCIGVGFLRYSPHVNVVCGTCRGHGTVDAATRQRCLGGTADLGTTGNAGSGGSDGDDTGSSDPS